MEEHLKNQMQTFSFYKVCWKKNFFLLSLHSLTKYEMDTVIQNHLQNSEH